MTSDVVLVPGLWMPAAAMALVAWRLSRAGYRTRSFAYRGRSSLEANVGRLARFAEGAPAHFVGHSLGGVLVYDMLVRHPEVAAGRVVLLGAPVRGSLAGRRLGTHAVGRWMLGACGVRWQAREAHWPRAEPLGVIAGTLPVGLGRTLGVLPGQNDGVVCVEETAIRGMSERVLVHEAHSMLAVSGHVVALVERFLRTARFA